MASNQSKSNSKTTTSPRDVARAIYSESKSSITPITTYANHRMLIFNTSMFYPCSLIRYFMCDVAWISGNLQYNQNLVASTALISNKPLLYRWLSLRSTEYHSENQLLQFTVPLCWNNRFIFEIIMVSSSDCLHFKDQRRIEEDHQPSASPDPSWRCGRFSSISLRFLIMKFIQLIDWNIQLQSWWQLVVVHYY
jgi:hypothetical protein